MLIFTFNKPINKKTRPADNVDNTFLATGKHRTPPAKYYRNTILCSDNNNCNYTEAVIKVIDCNACKITRSANTNISNNYYTSASQYMRSRCMKYEQGLTNFNLNIDTNAIDKQCSNTRNNCGVYKRSNQKYNTQGAVSSSTRLLRLKHDTPLI